MNIIRGDDMNEYTIKLTEKELINLKVFLSRTTLTGNEALEFVKLANKIETAKVVKEENGK